VIAPVTSTADELTDRLLRGDRAAVARLISWAENNDRRFPAVVSRIWPRVGRARRAGVTGPPGAGKSTLVNELTVLLRGRGATVGVLAVDPTSPFTGGALLGDRIRMEERTLDEGVYIRSMASRESRGGLARAAVDACDVMDAFGFDEVLVETVGVGQAEYDVVSAADSVLVVLCPGAGDGIQAMKAGLLEVADVLVVNKDDRPGADRLATDLEEAVHVRQAGRAAWATPVVQCSAGTGHGVGRVLEALDRHRAFLDDGRLESARRDKRLDQVRRVLSERLLDHVWGPAGTGETARALIASGAAPYDVAQRLLAGLLDRLPAREAGRVSTGGQP
jgi:GTPase